MPNAPKPAGPANGGKPTTRGAGGLRPVAPPKRGNRNLLVAVCGCGDKIRVSAGVLERCQPTCQVCDEPFIAS